jgi:hypothetical protein
MKAVIVADAGSDRTTGGELLESSSQLAMLYVSLSRLTQNRHG